MRSPRRGAGGGTGRLARGRRRRRVRAGLLRDGRMDSSVTWESQARTRGSHKPDRRNRGGTASTAGQASSPSLSQAAAAIRATSASSRWHHSARRSKRRQAPSPKRRESLGPLPVQLHAQLAGQTSAAPAQCEPGEVALTGSLQSRAAPFQQILNSQIAEQGRDAVGRGRGKTGPSLTETTAAKITLLCIICMRSPAKDQTVRQHHAGDWITSPFPPPH